MTKTLFCVSPYQAWSYHTDCDITIVSNVIKGFKPDKFLLLTCDGELNHCDLRENIRLATGCSNTTACKMCCKNKGKYVDKMKKIAEENSTRFVNKNIRMNGNVDDIEIQDRDYYLSEVCSYYRLDELNLRKVNIKENAMAEKLARQGSLLSQLFEEVIDDAEHNLGIIFNGRLSPYSDTINWCNKKNINVIVHERGRMDGLMNIRLNRKALDQQEFNYLVHEYMKIWKPNEYPHLSNLISKEFVGKGNLTSRIWKKDPIKIGSTMEETNKCTEKPIVALFLSSTDEAYNDDGTLLLEMQIQLLKTLVKIKKEDFISHIIVKPHPDTISRIDLTIQHSIVTTLVKEADYLEIYWPESSETIKGITNQADINIVPHSSVALELAKSNIPIITFQDSPFKNVAQEVMGIGEITDKELLKRLIGKQIVRRNKIQEEQRCHKETLNKLELSWLLWDSVKIPSHKFVDTKVDRSMERAGRNILRKIGEIANRDELNSCTLRDLFIKQAQKSNKLFKAHELILAPCSEIDSQKNKVNEKTGNLVDLSNQLYGITNKVKLIKSKWHHVPKKVQDIMSDTVVLVNGLYIYEDYLAIIYGWNIPDKAKRSWELVQKEDKKELSPMCLTMNKAIAVKIESLWREWTRKQTSDWSSIYDLKRFRVELDKNSIKCYSYKEPLLLSEQN